MARYDKLRTAIEQAAYRSGLLALWRESGARADALLKRGELLSRAHRGGLIILFHRVTERDDPFRMGIALRLFEQLCEHLARHYRVVDLETLTQHLRDNRPLPARLVALTFDDGFADNYHLALPILRRYGLPATVFVTTGAVSGEMPLWFMRIAWMLEHCAPKDIGRLAGVPIALHSLEARALSNTLLVERLKYLPCAQREASIAEMSEKLQVTDFSALRDDMVNWDQLREMDQAGFRAGAHTVSHLICSREELTLVEDELARSRAILEQQLGRPIDLFAYPNGQAEDYNDDVIAALKQAGFTAACTTIFGANARHTDPFQLRRVSLYAPNLAGLAIQLERFFYLS